MDSANCQFQLTGFNMAGPKQIFTQTAEFCYSNFVLTLSVPTPQNSQTHSNSLLASGDELFECVWPCFGVGTKELSSAS